MTRSGFLGFAKAALAASLLFAHVAKADPIPSSERVDPQIALPKQLDPVKVNEHLGARLPKDLAFKDQNGKSVTLGQYFDGHVPVILTFNYSDCPMLCSLMLNGLVEGLKKVSYVPGKDFRILTVSIDHKETPAHALRTQKKYVAEYGRPEAAESWHFLTGSEENVRAYAQALGFGYAYVPERKEYAHPSVVALGSPDGRIVRYLYGIEYPEQSLKLALLESSQGKIGNSLDRLILYCFHYDASIGRYAPVAAKVMRVGGAFSVVFLAGFLVLLWRADAKKRRRKVQPAESV